MKLKKFIFGSEAIEYIREILADGNTLSKYLLKSKDLTKGKVMTFLPPYLSKEEAKQFRTNEMIKVPPRDIFPTLQPDGRVAVAVRVRSTEPVLAGIIKEFLSFDARRFCIFEDFNREPSSAWTDMRIKTFRKEVYFILSKENGRNKKKIIDTLKDVSSAWHFVCAMAPLPKEGNFFQKAGKITEKELEILAERTEKIAVGAYDMVGYLIWSKD